ncbi:MAG: YchJ family protein [Myxococcales bacterium]|nr:YchJ family protein [Myxococcales bacterium]
MSCPCGSDNPYASCCGPLHDSERAPQTAEQLMRSRYSAYTRGDIDYLERTQIGDFNRAAAKAWAKRARWLGLTVASVERGGPDDDEGIVEFVARFSEGGSTRVHRERSRFRRVDGRWRYLAEESASDAEPAPVQPSRRAASKVGRNEPCPCGSGRKFKRCCGAS